MKLHFLGFLIGSSALSAAVDLDKVDIDDVPAHASISGVPRISTLAIPTFPIDDRTAAYLIHRPIDPIDLIVAQANPTFVSKGKIFIKTWHWKFKLRLSTLDGASTNIHVDAKDDPTGEKTQQRINAEILFRANKSVRTFFP